MWVFATIMLSLPLAADAAGVAARNYSTMEEFQASSLYQYITSMPGGPALNSVTGLYTVQQGSEDIPVNSAGFQGNSVVSTEVLLAVSGVPDVFSGSSNSLDYEKKFVSTGSGDVAGASPHLLLSLPPVSTLPEGGYQGYDIAIIDLGKNLSDGSGKQNSEATTFLVELTAEGVVYGVGQIRGTGGNFINIILLDVSGIPGMPDEVDGVRLVDVDDGSSSAREALDVDGVVRLNSDQPTQVQDSASWGRVKSLYR
jgi:hypothetical protein